VLLLLSLLLLPDLLLDLFALKVVLSFLLKALVVEVELFPHKLTS
jgi:hypothetical protein